MNKKTKTGKLELKRSLTRRGVVIQIKADDLTQAALAKLDAKAITQESKRVESIFRRTFLPAAG